MAKMYPPEISAATKSPAEISLFGKLRDELDDSWTVLHSVGVASGQRKPWSEIDFVCISETGIYCIEVKGGDITRRDGVWIQTNRHGQEFQHTESPFQQVASASTALHHYLRDHKVDTILSRRTVVGSGVATPDVNFGVEGPDINNEIVYDRSDAEQPFGDYLDRLGNYWHRFFFGTNQVTSIEPIAVRQLIDHIRGDFDLRLSLNQRINRIEQELVQLTAEQYEILDCLDIEANPRMLIRGGAGTGKTLCAVELARHHARAGRKVFLCCFNKALAGHLNSRTADMEEITVSNLHDFMETIVDEAGMLQDLSKDDLQEFFRKSLPEACKEALILRDQMDYFDALILDEGQDLMLDDYTEILDAVLKGGIQDGSWSVFWDPNQDIYGGIDPVVLELLRQSRPLEYRLTKNCRNTRQISDLACSLSGLELEEVANLDGISVEPRWYRDNADQRRKISHYVNHLLGEGIDPSDIVILSTRRLENSCLNEGLIEVPFPLVWWEDTGGAQYVDRGLITFSTLHAFKGLESEVVILADVENLVDELPKRQIYVGSSRGRTIMTPFILESQKENYGQT